jgi:hypothetical protein
MLLNNIKNMFIETMIIRGYSDQEISNLILNDDNNNDIEQYLQDNNIIQIYNKGIGIKNISYPISAIFWSMLQNVRGEVLLFNKELENINKVKVFEKLANEFNIKNIMTDIASMEINRRTNQIILILKDKTIKISELYGGIEYKGKSYWYEIKDMIAGYIGKDEEDNVYLEINGIKYYIIKE